MKKYTLFLIALFLVNTAIFPIRINDLSKLKRFPYQDSAQVNYCQSQPILIDNEIAMLYTGNSSPEDTIFLARSTDEGTDWKAPEYVASFERDAEEEIFISGTVSNTGRILVIYSIGETITNNKTKLTYSDDQGATWSVPQNIIGTAYIPYPKITQTQDGKLWVVGRNNHILQHR